MTALNVLLLAEAHGVTLRLDGEGGLRMRAAFPPPAEVVAMLREHRAALCDLMGHDAGEAEAMAWFYAQPAESDALIRAVPDPLRDGLATVFHAHRATPDQKETSRHG